MQPHTKLISFNFGGKYAEEAIRQKLTKLGFYLKKNNNTRKIVVVVLLSLSLTCLKNCLELPNILLVEETFYT